MSRGHLVPTSACLLALVLTAACGGSGAASVSSPATSEPTVAQDSPAAIDVAPPDPPSADAPSLQAVVTSASGYSFAISATLTLGTATVSTNTEAPGFAEITQAVRGSTSITNRTVGHDAPASETPSIGLVGIYPSSSAICSRLDLKEDAPFGSYMNDTKSVTEVLSGVNGQTRQDVCAVTFAGGSSVGDIASGATVTGQLVPDGGAPGYQCDNGPGTCAAVSPGNLVLNHVDETKAQAIASELTAGPPQWVMISGSVGCPERDYGTFYSRNRRLLAGWLPGMH